MRLLSKIFAALLVLAGLSFPASAVDLNGGTATFTFPENVDNMKASIAVTNNTKTLICDFVIKVVDSDADAPPFNISGAYFNDPQHTTTPENWDVDDNENGMLEAGESDDVPSTVDEKTRIEERGKDQCLGRGRSGSLELTFDANPKRGDRIKISPTSENGGVIFVSSMPVGCAEVREEDVLLATGEFGVANMTGRPVKSFPVSASPGVEIVAMESSTHGGYFNHYEQSYILDRPFTPEEEMAVYYELSGFNPDGGSTTVCLGEKGGVTPKPPVDPGPTKENRD